MKIGSMPRAGSTTARLPHLMPEYVPDPIHDAPGYVALMDLISGRKCRMQTAGAAR